MQQRDDAIERRNVRKHDKIEEEGWEKARKMRARAASAEATRAITEARRTQKMRRQGGVEEVQGRGRQVNETEGVEGEHEGKRRRVRQHNGRDGTGAVPNEVT